MNKIPNRKAICDVLLKEAETDKDIVVLCSDSRGSASLAPLQTHIRSSSLRWESLSRTLSAYPQVLHTVAKSFCSFSCMLPFRKKL